MKTEEQTQVERYVSVCNNLIRAGKMKRAKACFDRAYKLYTVATDEVKRQILWLRDNFYPVGGGCDCSPACYYAEARCVHDWED